MKIQNALVSNIFDRSQRYFAHVTTVTLSWRVQNIVVLDRVYFALECFEFSSNFVFDRNMLSGTGAWSLCRFSDSSAMILRQIFCSYLWTYSSLKSNNIYVSYIIYHDTFRRVVLCFIVVISLTLLGFSWPSYPVPWYKCLSTSEGVLTYKYNLLILTDTI